MTSNSVAAGEAATATAFWLRGELDACSATLQRIELDDSLHSNDFKVQHNLAIVEHCLSRSKESRAQLVEQLQQIIREEALSNTSGDSDPEHREGGNVEVALLNRAILHYQDGQNDEAVQILEGLLPTSDSSTFHIDEGTTLHAFILLLDIHLQGRDAVRAGKVLGMLEGAFVDLEEGFGASGGGGTRMSSAGPVVSMAGLASGPPSSASTTPRQEGTGNTGVFPHGALSLAATAAAAAVALPVNSPPLAPYGDSVNWGGALPGSALPFMSKWRSSTVARARQLLTSQGVARQLTPPSMPALVGLYRARLSLLRGDAPAAAAALASIRGSTLPALLSPPPPLGGVVGETSPADGPVGARDLSAALTVAEAQLSMQVASSAASATAASAMLALASSFQEGAGGLAASTSLLFPTIPVSQDLPLLPVIHNNIGVTLHAQSKHQLALMSFSRALEVAATSAAQTSERGQAEGADSCATTTSHQHIFSDGSLSPSQRHSVLYNQGVQHLMLGQHAAALSCFGRCSDGEALVEPLPRGAQLLEGSAQPLGLKTSASAGPSGSVGWISSGGKEAAAGGFLHAISDYSPSSRLLAEQGMLLLRSAEAITGLHQQRCQKHRSSAQPLQPRGSTLLQGTGRGRGSGGPETLPSMATASSRDGGLGSSPADEGPLPPVADDGLMTQACSKLEEAAAWLQEAKRARLQELEKEQGSSHGKTVSSSARELDDLALFILSKLAFSHLQLQHPGPALTSAKAALEHRRQLVSTLHNAPTPHDGASLPDGGRGRTDVAASSLPSLSTTPPMVEAWESRELSACFLEAEAAGMMAACYAAEALALLGREQEAVEVLAEAHDRQGPQSSSYKEGDAKVDPTAGLLEVPGSPLGGRGGELAYRAARQALCANLAAMLARGHWPGQLSVAEESGRDSRVGQSGPATRDGAVSNGEREIFCGLMNGEAGERSSVVRAIAEEAVKLSAPASAVGMSDGPKGGFLSGGTSTGAKAAAMVLAFVHMREGRCGSALDALRRL